MKLKYLERFLCYGADTSFVTVDIFSVMDKVPREIIQKSINARVMVLALCTLSNVD